MAATATAPIQRTLRLEVASDTRLVSMETAKAALGVGQLTIDGMIDAGELVAFNISPRHAGRVREIRIWLRSLDGTGAGAGLEAVIDDVLGDASTAELRSGEVQARLCVDEHTVLRLQAAGLLQGECRRNARTRTLWVTKASLSTFLRARVLGAASE